jgi:translocation and assembly module TamB
LSTEPLSPDYYRRPDTPRARNLKKVLLWILISIVGLLAGLFLALFALLQAPAFRQYLLRVTHQRLTDALGTELRMRDFGFHLSGFSPTVDMYDVVIDGAAPYTTPPLMRVDHMSVSVQVVSLLRRNWYLRDIVVDHPVARVIVDARGASNLPTSKNSSQTSVFDLGVRHMMLRQGEIYYNDRKSTLDADLHDLEFESNFDAVRKVYLGGLSYHNGSIHVQDLNPLPHDFEAEFEATPNTFTLTRSVLRTGMSQVSLSGTLDDYAMPRVTARYLAALDSGELRQVLKNTTLPVGIVHLEGSAQYQADANRPLLALLGLDGTMTSPRLQIETEGLRTDVRDLNARYSIHKGDADVHDVTARLLGGSITASLKIRDLAEAQQSELHAVLQNVALASVQTLMTAKAPQFRIAGTGNASVDATWRKTFENLTARADAKVKGTIAPSRAAASGNVPIESEIHAHYNAVSEEIAFAPSYVRMPKTSVTLNGTVSGRSAVQVQLQSHDLHELETVADAFGLTDQALGLYGTASFIGTVRGSTASPQISGQLTGSSLKLRGTEWRKVQMDVSVDRSRLLLRDGDIQPATQGRVAFNADVGLDHWAVTADSPMRINVRASQLNVADFTNITGSGLSITGMLSANLVMSGSQQRPTGEGMVTLTRGSISGEPIQSATLNLQGTGDEIRGLVDLRMTAGAAQASFKYQPAQMRYDARLAATGIRLDQFQTLRARNLQIAGVLDLQANGTGTLDNPGLQLSARIPQLQIQNQVISGFTLQSAVANRVATIALDSRSRDTYVRGHGELNLSSPYEVDATFDTSPISLQPLVAMYLPAQASTVIGQTEIHLTAKGPLKDTSLLDARVTLPTFSIAYKDSIQLAAVEPIEVRYANGILALQRTVIRGTGTDLQLQGTIPLNSAAPLALIAVGTVDLRLAQLADPDILSSGQLQLNINGSGQRNNPNVQGQIKIVNANFAGNGAPLGLQDGNGVLTVSNNGININEFHGRVGGGMLTAKGGITYRPSVQFNLSVAGTGIRLLYPHGVREGLDTNLTLVGSTASSVLRGQVRLNELSFSPSFDVADIVGELSGATTTPPQGVARNMQLDISVNSTNDLNLVSSKLSLQGAANLRVRGTAANPVVLGRVNMSGGDLIFRGNRYILLPSSLDFVNPFRIEPMLNVSVDTTVQEYNIHLLFRGPVDQIRTTYTSDPALPPADIISLLVFGKTETAEGTPTPGNLGAESLIASSVSNQITNRIEKIAGISQLSIDPILGGNSQDPNARVTLQQRITGNLFVTFATDATSTQHEVIKVEYQATPKVSVSGVRDQNGGFAVDFRIKKTW